MYSGRYMWGKDIVELKYYESNYYFLYVIRHCFMLKP